MGVRFRGYQPDVNQRNHLWHWDCLNRVLWCGCNLYRGHFWW